MTADAKLGMVIGVGVVIVIAALFFRTDSGTVPAPGRESPTTANNAPHPYPTGTRGQSRPVQARTATRDTTITAGRTHTVQEGETLFSLAQKYYGDGERYAEIYHANSDILTTPDSLMPGTVLFIPNLPLTSTRSRFVHEAWK